MRRRLFYRLGLLALVADISSGCTPHNSDCVRDDLSCSPVALLLYFPCVQVNFVGAVQGCPLNLSGLVTTVAGDGSANFADGTGTSALFDNPNGSAFGPDGFAYLADSSNARVRRIDPATLEVTTVVSGLSGAVRDVAVEGNLLYITDSAATVIRQHDLTTGVTTVLAGSGVAATVDGIGTAAQFSFPHGILAHNGFVYVAQPDHVIRRIDLGTREVVSYIGTPGVDGYLDGHRSVALLSGPIGMTIVGNVLYFTEIGTNHTIRAMDLSTEIVSTVTGTPQVAGGNDGIGTSASFNDPYSLTSDGHSLFVTEWNGHAVRRVELRTRQVTRLAGEPGVSGDSDGLFDQARFQQPRGLTTNGTYLIISDTSNHKIRILE